MGKIDEIINKFKTVTESSSPIVDKVTKQNDILTQSIKEYSQQVDSLKKSADGMTSAIDMGLNTTLGSTGADLDKILEQQRDYIDSLKAIKSMIGRL